MAACFECDAPADHMHHVVPRVLGGTRTIPLCESCHGKVHSRDMTGHRRLTKAGLDAKRAKGERVGSIPYGYRLGKDGKTLVPHEKEQAVIRQILTWREKGWTYRAIAETLVAMGIRDRNSKPQKGKTYVARWYATSIHRIVTKARERIEEGSGTE